MGDGIRQRLKGFPPLARLNHWRHATFSRPEYDAEVELEIQAVPETTEKDAPLLVDVRARNCGRHAWTPERGVKLELSLINPRGLEIERHRYAVPATVAPGETADMPDLRLLRWRHAGKMHLRARMIYPPSPFRGGGEAMGSVTPPVAGHCVQLSFWNARMVQEACEALARKGTADFPVRILNAGTEPLGPPDDAVGWHLESQDCEILLWDTPRVPLPERLEPGEQFLAVVPVSVPQEYRETHPEGLRLQFDLVREGQWWASNSPIPPDLKIPFATAAPQQAPEERTVPVVSEPPREPRGDTVSESGFPSRVPITIEYHDIDGAAFASFEQAFQAWIDQRKEVQRMIPGSTTWGVIEPPREKVLEYFLTTKLLDLQPGERLLDIASCTSLFPNYAGERFKIAASRQDLFYEDGTHRARFPAVENEALSIEMECIGSDACDLPLDDASVDTMTLHCSLEHFEGDADGRFFREAMRVLRPGGRILIIPFYCGPEPTEVYHPHFAPGCRFHRYYSPESFTVRILDTLTVPYRAQLHHFRNTRELGDEFYCDLALILTRVEEKRKWWLPRV